jgi:iron complex outermembrane recepter protein
MRSIYLLSLMFLGTLAFGQRTISGTVSSEDEGPLLGATVLVKGSVSGTVTDSEGKYQIQVPDESAVLVFSFIGYTTQEVVAGSRTTINVVLRTGRLLEEIVVTGSRGEGRTKLTTAVPVDVLDIKNLLIDAPQTNLNQILNYVAPSFSSNTQTISDGTDHIDPASLRGLGPDQVLVLINGKRRHTSSLVNVNGTFGRGNVGTDLNSIPAAAIDRIEVLRDGAAAQYGSDAIAGVINIILKNDYDKLSSSFTTGAYASKNSNFLTGGLDGEAYDLSVNYGLPLGPNGGFVNFTGNFESRDWTSRMEALSGQIFNAYNGVERLAMAQGLDISNLSIEQVRDLSQNLTYLSAEEKDIIKNADEATLRSRNAANNPLFKDVSEDEMSIRGLDRTDFNMRVGQSALRGGKFFMNMAYPVSNNAEVYAFGGIGIRDGLATGFYRLPHQERTYTPAFPNGFLPEIHSDILDKSFSAGIRGQVKGWNLDFSNTYGRNSFLYEVHNSVNTTMQNATPFEFSAGGFAFSQNTTNFDMSRKWDDVMAGFNLAFGAEYRVENYEIFAGAENSYANYDRNLRPVTPTTPDSLLVRDFFNRVRPGGAQVFPGFRPDNELSAFRNSVAGYFDIEADITEDFLLSLATRFENYSDFGSTTNFKGAARYKLGDNFSVRGAASTGFRAPSLAQIHFNSTSTLFVDGVPFEVGTFSNTSRIARILGIPRLKEETSVSYSLGITGRIPQANLSVTIDAFQVDIDDRVVLTGQFAPGNNAELQRLFAQANAERATFFANAIDTRTQGLDIVVTHDARLGNALTLKTNLAATFSQTRQQGEVKASDQLEPVKDTYFDETSRLFLEEAVPTEKANLTFTLSGRKFNIFLRNVYFGPVIEATNVVENQQEFAAKVITDLSVSYSLINNLRLTLGANNLLDVYPDENIPANQGTAQFLYSRRSQQFGFQGRFIFARLAFNL